LVAVGRSTVDTPVNMRDYATARSLPVDRPTTAPFSASRCVAVVQSTIEASPTRVHRGTFVEVINIFDVVAARCRAIVIAHLTPAFNDDRPTLPPRVGRHQKAQDRNVKDYVADGGI